MTVFFFQAEDGIRDYKVTGVQTCALPISCVAPSGSRDRVRGGVQAARAPAGWPAVVAAAAEGGSRCLRCREIGRASCREREESAVGGMAVNGRGGTGDSTRAEIPPDAASV